MIQLRTAAVCLMTGLSLVTQPISAQQRFLNLDFEKAGYAQPHLPWGWHSNVPGYVPPETIALDSMVSHSGRRSVRLTKSSGVVLRLALPIPKASLAAPGTAVRLSAWIRSGGTAGNFTMLAGGVDSATTHVVVPAAPAGDWKRYQIDSKLDDRGEFFQIILNLVGNGTVWVDEIELHVDGVRVDSIFVGVPPSEGQRTWLAAQAVSLQPAASQRDGAARILSLDPLHKLMAGAKVVAVGESTHGTLEFGQLRRDVVEYAARSHGATVVALEESQLTADALNHWVHGGTGDLRRLLETGPYPGTRRSEMAALLEWMRRYNATAVRKLDFVGVDMANITEELDSVRIFMAQVDPEHLSSSRPLYDLLYRIWSTRGFAGHSRDSLVSWRDGAARVVEHMRSRRAAYATAANDVRAARMTRYASAVHQGAILLLTSPNDFLARDSIMAANLVRELDSRGPDTRAVFFAHSMHVSREPRRMGDFMTKHIGPAYVAISSVSYQGTYLASRPSSTPFELGAKVPVPLGPAFLGSVEEMLHGIGRSPLGLDLRSAVVQEQGRWLAEPRHTTYASAAVADIASRPMPLGSWWDGLLFIDTTSAATYAPCTVVPVPRCWR